MSKIVLISRFSDHQERLTPLYQHGYNSNTVHSIFQVTFSLLDRFTSMYGEQSSPYTGWI